MAKITAALVKELREKTSAGMMDCKKALTETDGDVEAAVDWLRKKGLAAAAKKAGRVAAEGLVAVNVKGTDGVVVELNAETDFVARNDEFQGFVAKIAEVAIDTNGDVEAVKAAEFPGAGKPVGDALTDLIAKIGENMTLRRTEKLSVSKGTVVSYVHNQVSPGLGKIGVLVALESEADTAKLDELGKQIAMHVAAAMPMFLNTDDVDQDLIARERKVLTEQALASGKPENIVEKMVDGRLRKYYEEIVLNEQVYVIDTDKKVKQVIEAASKELGAPVKLAGFVRYALGEGVEKKEEDFAAEVAAQVNK